MCEAQVEQVRTTFELSNIMTVSTSPTGQVIFKITPEKEYMKPHEVALSRQAWTSFMKNARSHVQRMVVHNKYLMEGQEPKEDIWEYHPNSKYVRVSRSMYGGGGSLISLLTMNRRGTELKKFCVYMNQQEWEALDMCADELTANIKNVQPKSSSSYLSDINYLPVYRWKFVPTLQEKDVPVCIHNYYKEEHCKEKGMEVSLLCTVPLGTMEIVKDRALAWDPLKFYMMVYFSLLYRCCAKINSMNCSGCQKDEPKDHPSHRNFNGCQAFGRQVVQDYLKPARAGVCKAVLDQVFFRCWKFFKLVIVDVDTMWKNMSIIFPEEDEKCDYIERRVVHVKDNYNLNPELLLINDYIKDDDLEECLVNYVCVSLDPSESEEGPSPSKKINLSIDSVEGAEKKDSVQATGPKEQDCDEDLGLLCG